MFRFIRRLWYRAFPPKLPELEIADNALNRSSNFWWSARDQKVKLMNIGPDGLYDVALLKVYKPGESVTDDNGVVTHFPNGAEQGELVQGVNPARFKVKGKVG